MIDTDVLVIGAGAGGLLAALGAKRRGKRGTRVSLLDSWTVGRTGHTAFTSAHFIATMPGDDIDAVAREIIEGNDWIADQRLVREVVATSAERVRDIEGLGVAFPRDAKGDYVRRPTRGLDSARLIGAVGGGLEFCWRLRLGLEAEGVQILDRIFVTGLMRGTGERIIGAVGIHSRSGAFHVIKARTTIICTNSVSFRSGFARDITGTGTLLAYRAGATLRNAEFSYTRPGAPKFYFEGITFAAQEGACFVNAHGERFMPKYEPLWGDEADVPRIARAMVIERQKGNHPLYLDMSGIPESLHPFFLSSSKVKWMEYFYRKLGDEVKTNMFGKTPYYPLNQMTKMGVRTDETCRSDVQGLLVGGLAQAGCANHFAGFHIGLSIGNGWIAGCSAVEDLDRLPPPRLDPIEVRALHGDTFRAHSDRAVEASDHVLRELQALMFAYDISIWKQEERLRGALKRLETLKDEMAQVSAPHVHELVRLKETDAMLLAAELILHASLYRTESRVSHFREDYDFRDDGNWLCWVDINDVEGTPQLAKTPVPTPLYPVTATRTEPVQRRIRGATV
ncbi:MAG TPA: FAD-binding protein [Stellaceae bacterium]|nr:FAD-binding protein [Stellaceae bacterium]